MSALQQNISGTNIHHFSFINILPLTLHATALCLQLLCAHPIPLKLSVTK